MFRLDSHNVPGAMCGTMIDRVIAIFFITLASVDCLRCWHCIAENCATDPSENYKASEKICRPDQSCQKVYFEMVEETEKGDSAHMSTVRGCSTDCIERNDFLNCTDQLKTSRGCVRKDCCNDGDLCNGAVTACKSRLIIFHVVIILLCLLLC